MGINLNKKYRDEHSFVIQIDYHNDTWYFADLDPQGSTIGWHSNIDKAQKFESTQEVTDFCSIYIPNKRYNIVRIK